MQCLKPKDYSKKEADSKLGVRAERILGAWLHHSLLLHFLFCAALKV